MNAPQAAFRARPTTRLPLRMHRLMTSPFSVSGGRIEDANNVRHDLIFDPRALPSVLVGGLPSALASPNAGAPGARGVSPYDFFADVIDVPHSANARAFKAVSFALFTPSPNSQLSDFLSASNDFFGPPTGDIASRRAIPVSADAGALYGALTMQRRVMPTLSRSPLSGRLLRTRPSPSGKLGTRRGGRRNFLPMAPIQTSDRCRA